MVQTPDLATLLHAHCDVRLLSFMRILVVQAVGFTGAENLAKALEGADLVVIPAGVPRKPGKPVYTAIDCTALYCAAINPMQLKWSRAAIRHRSAFCGCRNHVRMVSEV